MNLTKKEFFKIPIFVWLLILLGTFLTSMTMLRSGILNSSGIGFWGPNGHDAIWHLGVISEILKKTPPNNPVFAGLPLLNYHWGFDFFAAYFSKILNLNILDVYFRFLPFIFGILIGIFSYLIAKKNTNKLFVSFWFIFLNYFAGSFGWIVTLIREHQIGGESLFWSMQSISTLLNPPFAMSLVILLIGIYLWSIKRKENNVFWAIIIGLIFGVLSGIKVYAGILIGLSAGFFLLFKLIKRKSEKFDFIIVITTAVSAFLLLFLLGALSGSSLLVFQPFWFIHSMIESVDKLYLPRVASFRINLANLGFSYKFFVLVALEIFLLFLFLIGNLGTRILGFFVIFKKFFKNKISDFDFLVLIFMFFSFLIPMLFVQKGTAWNTIQFFYYFLFFANYYFAIFLEEILIKKSFASKLIVLLLVVLTIPTSFSTLKDYFGNPSPSYLPSYEIEALNFLKKQKDGFVLTSPYDKFQKNNLKTPISLRLYETTAYVPAFSGKSTFLDDEMNLDITGYNWQKRREESANFFNQKSVFEDRGFLINNKISYIYLVDNQTFASNASQLQINKIFDNGRCQIFQVQR